MDVENDYGYDASDGTTESTEQTNAAGNQVKVK
jgi:hypothetical protein